MTSRTLIAAAGVAVLALAASSPAAAESWALFSTTDRTAYLVDVDTLSPVDNAAVARIARVPREGDADDQSYETEEIEVRCGDRKSRSGVSVSYGPDGVETDRYADETPWETARAETVYAQVVSFVCGDLQPAGAPTPTIAAFIAAGRK